MERVGPIQLVDANLKISIIENMRFFYSFATFNFLTKIGEKSAHLFKERKELLFFLLREKKKRNKNNQEGVLDYSLHKKGF